RTPRRTQRLPRHHPLPFTLADRPRHHRAKGRKNMTTRTKPSSAQNRDELVMLQAFRCANCGYGATSRHAPARCPMCSGKAWSIEVRGDTTLLQDLDPTTRPDSSNSTAVDADLPLGRESIRDQIFPGLPFS